MKHTIFLSAFFVILAVATFATAQESNRRVTFSEPINPYGGGMGMGKVTVQDVSFNGNLQIFEVIVGAATPEQCYASRDFSGARVVGPDRATLSYDFSRLRYELRFVTASSDPDKCRVLLVGETASTARLTLWRANFGRSAFADGALMESGARAGGDRGNASHWIELNSFNW